MFLHICDTRHIRVFASPIDWEVMNAMIRRSTPTQCPPPDLRVRSPYGFEVIESCIECEHRGDYTFCNLPSGALEKFNEIRSAAVYPKGAILFLEGQAPRGIFILCHGRAKLTVSSEQGKTIIVRIAEAGEVLGLSAALSGRTYQATAETLEPCEANFISREDFLAFLGKEGDAAVNAAQEITNHYHAAYRDVRSLGLATSANARIARLLLDWANETPDRSHFHQRLTHEEIAQLIGSSRETVTRVLSSLKRKKLIVVKGARVVLQNRQVLENLASS